MGSYATVTATVACNGRRVTLVQQIDPEKKVPDGHRSPTIGPWSYGPAVLKWVGPDGHRSPAIGPWY